MEALAAAAFAAGLLGGVHCAGMCGGIVGSLSAAARGPALPRQLAFNLGRIASYAMAGAAAGAAGGLLQLAGPALAAQTVLFVAANVLMVLLGMYVAGWGTALLRLESAGARLWRSIEPLRRRFFPIDTTARALGAGAVWGGLPCGLVYSMLALALASGGAAAGALVMLAFGLGTLPNLLAAGLAAHKVLALRRIPWVRRAAGAAIIAMAVFGLLRAPRIQEAILAGWQCLA
ncbi:MAG TPA: sulfite exporter TauE/SafE family protein [Myxococcota bacterium]|nr:sulfite exporter TauE/SafE family protein [Myxococcota bacterium]